MLLLIFTYIFCFVPSHVPLWCVCGLLPIIDLINKCPKCRTCLQCSTSPPTWPFPLYPCSPGTPADLVRVLSREKADGTTWSSACNLLIAGDGLWWSTASTSLPLCTWWLMGYFSQVWLFLSKCGSVLPSLAGACIVPLLGQFAPKVVGTNGWTWYLAVWPEFDC